MELDEFHRYLSIALTLRVFNSLGKVAPMPASENPGTKNHLSTYDAPQHDDYDAVSVDGFDEDEDIESEKRPRIAAIKGANPLQGIFRFFHLYLNSRAYSSRAELVWGLAYAVVSTLLVFCLLAWMGTVVHTGGDSVSSLFRVLYMLIIVVAPVWLVVHITPSINLIKRYGNFKNSLKS